MRKGRNLEERVADLERKVDKIEKILIMILTKALKSREEGLDKKEMDR